MCKSIRSAYPDYKVVVVTAWPEDFLNNPDIYRVYKFGSIPYFYEDYIKDKNTKIFRLEPYQAEKEQLTLPVTFCKRVHGVPPPDSKSDVEITCSIHPPVPSDFTMEI